MAPPGLSPTETGSEPAHSSRPHLGSIVRRVALSLLIACVVPISVFYVFRDGRPRDRYGGGATWSYGAIAWRALTGRRASGLLILTAVVLTGRTAIALAADSGYLYFLQPIISDNVVGAAFLLSLSSARPMVARLAGDFYPMDHELHLRPRVRRLFKTLTVMWARLCLGKAMVMLWVLESQSLETFVPVQSISTPTLNGLAAAATIGLAVLVARKEGLLAHPGPPSLSERRSRSCRGRRRRRGAASRRPPSQAGTPGRRSASPDPPRSAR